MITNSSARYVICVDNADYLASLETRKIYEALPDPDAAQVGQVRVIDESGEDYLYPAERFIPIELPKDVREALRKAS